MERNTRRVDPCGSINVPTTLSLACVRSGALDGAYNITFSHDVIKVSMPLLVRVVVLVRLRCSFHDGEDVHLKAKFACALSQRDEDCWAQTGWGGFLHRHHGVSR